MSAPFSASLYIKEAEGERQITCRSCEHGLVALGAPWKPVATVRERPMNGGRRRRRLCQCFTCGAAPVLLPRLRRAARFGDRYVGRPVPQRRDRGLTPRTPARWRCRMHDTEVRQEIVDRVLARRGRYHVFDSLDPKETAFVVIDMQGTFVAPGSPAEVPTSRGIIGNINALATELRTLGVLICWVTHANRHTGTGSDWDGFFNNFVGEEVRQRTIESLSPEGDGQKVWHELTVEPSDLHVIKNRYSALIAGSSQLERILRSRRIRNVLIAGTKTKRLLRSDRPRRDDARFRHRHGERLPGRALR